MEWLGVAPTTSVPKPEMAYCPVLSSTILDTRVGRIIENLSPNFSVICCSFRTPRPREQIQEFYSGMSSEQFLSVLCLFLLSFATQCMQNNFFMFQVRSCYPKQPCSCL